MKIQTQIGIWHRATFGNSNILNRLLSKFKEESNEFLEDPSESEFADCMIVLIAYANRMGWNVESAIETKFKEVSSRLDQIERDRKRGIE